MFAYCRSSPECQEVLQILDVQRRKVSEVREFANTWTEAILPNL